MEAVLGILGDIIGIGGSLLGGSSAKKASAAAQKAQVDAINNAILAQQQGYQNASGILSPYTGAGAEAQSSLNDILGIGGQAGGLSDWDTYLSQNPDVMDGYNALSVADKAKFPTPESYAQYHYQTYGKNEGRALPTTTGQSADDAQAAQITALQQSPLYQSLYRTGQEAVLQNGSATGGLRGGNIQSALANFGQDTLSKVIQDRIANLSGVTGQGLQAATGVANAATGTASNVANLNTQIGDANAGGILQRSTINSNMIGQVSKGLGSIVNSNPFTSLLNGAGIKI